MGFTDSVFMRVHILLLKEGPLIPPISTFNVKQKILHIPPPFSFSVTFQNEGEFPQVKLAALVNGGESFAICNSDDTLNTPFTDTAING